jgi:hypothetical protein
MGAATVAPPKSAGIYRVIANVFTFPFTFGGTRTVKRLEEVQLTAKEAAALTSGPVLVEGPKPGSVPTD